MAKSVELDLLPGIGATKAQAIIHYREINGYLLSVDYFILVSGMDLSLFDQFRALIIVGDIIP